MNLNDLRAAKDSINAAFKRVRIYSGNFEFLNPKKMTVKEVQAEFELQRDIGRDMAMALMHAREVLDGLEQYLIATEVKRREAIKLLAGPEALGDLPTETAAAESPLANIPVGIS